MEEHVEGTTGLGWGQILIGAAALLCGVWGALSLVLAPTPVARPGTMAVQPHHHGAQKAVRGASLPVNCARVACLALTFDDGPSPTVTPQVLDILARHHVRATFYVVGSRVPGNEALLRRMYHDGHEIGNHTWSHTDLTTLNPAQVQDQIARTQAAVAAAGVPLPTTFRPPYGAVNAVVRANVPLTIVRWNVDPEDWGTPHPEDIIKKVEATARPGGVVELHDIHQQTADALEQLLNDLSPHYQWVTVSELFNLPPGQRGEFFGR